MKNIQLSSVKNKYKWSVIIFAVLFLEFLINMQIDHVNSWVFPLYVMDYSYGFASKLLMGTIVDIFIPGYIDATYIWKLFCVSYLVLCAIISFMIGKLLNKVKSNEGLFYGVTALILLLWASPANVSYLLTYENTGRLDLYLLIFTMISIMLVLKMQTSFIRSFILSILGVAACLIHQAFLFICLPVLIAILIYETFTSDKFTKSLFLNIIPIIAVGVIFLYLQFFSGINVESSEALVQTLQSQTDGHISKHPIEYEYFHPMSYHLENLVAPHRETSTSKGIYTLLLMSPMIVVLFSMWKDVICNSNKMQKVQYFLMLSCNLLFIPTFILAVDWGRWFAAFFITNVSLICYLAYKNDTLFVDALKRVYNYFKNHIILFAIILIFLSSLGKFEGAEWLDAVEKIYFLVGKFVEKIFVR